MEKNQESESIKTTGSQSEGMAIGLDIGTSRVVLATGSAGQVKTASELNAFVTVPYSKFTENILKQNKVSFQHNGGGGSVKIFGNGAERFGNLLHAEVQRPMLARMVNQRE